MDISNKLSPKVDASVVDTLARSCRHLTVLKLSDHRLEDPKSLLVLCGRVVVSPPANNADLAEREDRVARGVTISVPTSEPVVLLHANNHDQLVPSWDDHGSVETPKVTDGVSNARATEKEGSPAASTRLSERLEELHVSLSPVGKPAVNELTHREVCLRTVYCSVRASVLFKYVSASGLSSHFSMEMEWLLITMLYMYMYPQLANKTV